MARGAHVLFQGRVETVDHVLADLRFVVPVGVVFGESDAFALYRVTDHGARTVGRQRQSAKHLAQSLDIVTVDVDGGKIKCPPLVAQRLQVLDFTGRAGGLDLVVIYDSREIAKLVLARAQGRLLH